MIHRQTLLVPFAQLNLTDFFASLLVIGTFVMCQYWTSVMFTKEIVGEGIAEEFYQGA